MNAAEVPVNEIERLFALQQYRILDSEPEQEFDELAELAATICGTSIALITLVDSSRQWFKARVGLSIPETSRSVAFCAHAILKPNLFIVPDTHKDSRFADNPLVTGAPNIRFYAGAPLITETGEGLGTLCVIDTVSRELTTQQQRALMVLRTHVLKLMELRIQTRSLYELKQELDEYKHTISHDLRAPLRSVIGFSKILIEDHAPELDENVQSLLQRILTEGSRMDQLTSELVYLLRLESTKLEILQVNLSELANRELAHLQSTQPDRKINISIQPGLTTTGDLNLLRTMLHELFYNAWKYTQHTPEARIEFGRLNDNESKEYYLRDNGIGFEMAYAKKLFQPFQTMHVAPELHGIGVGLAKVKKIIQKHAGHVRAESFPEEGTTIYFTLAG